MPRKPKKVRTRTARTATDGVSAEQPHQLPLGAHHTGPDLTLRTRRGWTERHTVKLDHNPDDGTAKRGK